MSSENIDLGAVIALLESKRAALDSAINALRAVVATGAMGAAPEGATVDFTMPFSASGSSGGIPDGAFHGKSLPEAIRLYLELMRKRQTAREIAEGLKKGGTETTSKYFLKMIYATLDRLKKSGHIVKIEGSWGLPTWYPALMRAGVGENGQKPRRKGRPRKILVEVKATKSLPSASEEVKRSVRPKKPKRLKSEPGPSESIKLFLRVNPGLHDVEEIRSAAKIENANVATMLLGQLIKKGEVEKTTEGKYRKI